LQHLVINGASDLLHEIFEGDDGHHARSAIGFAQLPTGVAVEIEAIFEIKGRVRQLRNSRLRAACPRTARVGGFDAGARSSVPLALDGCAANDEE
jgi:hypothetical protein